MKTNFEMEEVMLTEEQQKEYDYIDGKIKRRSPTFPHEHYRWGELREEVKKKQLEKMYKEKNK